MFPNPTMILIVHPFHVASSEEKGKESMSSSSVKSPRMKSVSKKRVKTVVEEPNFEVNPNLSQVSILPIDMPVDVDKSVKKNVKVKKSLEAGVEGKKVVNSGLRRMLSR